MIFRRVAETLLFDKGGAAQQGLHTIHRTYLEEVGHPRRLDRGRRLFSGPYGPYYTVVGESIGAHGEAKGASEDG
ncbi:MAG TPA: hypothetical protein VEY13_13845 [Rubrobacteraceae bacterium]|nr:hypothetical protein [Rubrobacteraceae bacterium]